MKKIWCFLLSWSLILFNGLLTSCIAKFELTELFQSTKNVNISTDEVNHLVEMKMVNDINNRNKINFESIDFDKVLSFFLKQGKSLDEYIILDKRPFCYADSSLKNKKAIYTEIKHTEKQDNDQLKVEFHLNIYCVWKKGKNVYAWEKTSLNKIITLIIKSDQKIIF